MNTELQLVTTGEFEGVRFDCYQDKGNEFWGTREQIGEMLGYANPRDAIAKIHQRNKERLDKYSGVVNLSTPGGEQKVTVYNFKGLLEICRYSNQPKADAVMDFLWEMADRLRKDGYVSIHPDAVKRLELAEKRLEIQRKNADVRRAKLLQRMIERPEYPITDDSKRVLIHEVTLLTTGRAHPEILPDLTEKLYSATEVGAALGASNREVHKIARALNIRPDEGTRNEYGVWKMGKSPYSARECPQLFFTEAGKDRITGALCVEEE